MASGLYVCVTCKEGCDDACRRGRRAGQRSAGRKGLCFSRVSLHATMKEKRMRIRVVVSTTEEGEDFRI